VYGVGGKLQEVLGRLVSRHGRGRPNGATCTCDAGSNTQPGRGPRGPDASTCTFDAGSNTQPKGSTDAKSDAIPDSIPDSILDAISDAILDFIPDATIADACRRVDTGHLDDRLLGLLQTELLLEQQGENDSTHRCVRCSHRCQADRSQRAVCLSS